MQATFEPTDEQRRVVRAMAGLGLPHDDIAVLIDLDTPTLRHHFQRDLVRGAAEGTAKVAQTLFQLATVDRNVSAVVFWMKARAGWRERVDNTHQLLGADGQPVEILDTRRPISELLTEAERDAKRVA